MDQEADVTVVVPLFDEEENVAPLVEAIRHALESDPRTADRSWELVLVDDGSRDGTRERVEEAARRDPRVRPVMLTRNYGQATAMQAGFDRARGKMVVSLDGDLQNDPRDIPRLLEKLDEGYDLVAGYRLRRKDPWLTRKVPSWVANRIIRLITGVPIRDNGCSLKAYRRSMIERMNLYSDLHRFVPAVMASTHSERITEIPVRHHPRRRGSSKYGLSRVWKVLVDLLTVAMIRWFRDRPLVLFGWAALASSAAGAFFLARSLHWMGQPIPEGADAVVLPGGTLLLFGLAFWFVMLGLIAEVVVRRSREGVSRAGAGGVLLGRGAA